MFLPRLCAHLIKNLLLKNFFSINKVKRGRKIFPEVVQAKGLGEFNNVKFFSNVELSLTIQKDYYKNL